MRNHIFCLLLLCMLLACDRDSAVEAGASPPAANVATPGAASPSVGKPIVLADNYTPTFALQVRSQRHEEFGTKFRHVVITEYINLDAAAVIAAIQSDLTDKGFDVEAPVAHGDAIRLIGKKTGLQFIADIYAAPALELHAENARGIVSFTWVDSEAR